MMVAQQFVLSSSRLRTLILLPPIHWGFHLLHQTLHRSKIFPHFGHDHCRARTARSCDVTLSEAVKTHPQFLSKNVWSILHFLFVFTLWRCFACETVARLMWVTQIRKKRPRSNLQVSKASYLRPGMGVDDHNGLGSCIACWGLCIACHNLLLSSFQGAVVASQIFPAIPRNASLASFCDVNKQSLRNNGVSSTFQK